MAKNGRQKTAYMSILISFVFTKKYTYSIRKRYKTRAKRDKAKDISKYAGKDDLSYLWYRQRQYFKA